MAPKEHLFVTSEEEGQQVLLPRIGEVDQSDHCRAGGGGDDSVWEEEYCCWWMG